MKTARSVDSIGGGVCQISTTLYNASLYAELEIVQRQNHSMTVSYVKPSMDAAIAGTYKDLKIKNPYDTPIYIEGYTQGKDADLYDLRKRDTSVESGRWHLNPRRFPLHRPRPRRFRIRASRQENA